MKILLISDTESPYLWDHYRPGRLDGIDLIISCGDLKPSYLSFLVTMGRAPVLYVHGNHDGNYSRTPPEGCDCIDDDVVCVKGLRIMGLGGCHMYSGGPHQYSEHQMEKRIKKLRGKVKKLGGVDLIVSHAPVRGVGDCDTLCHRGFEAFRTLISELKPKYFVHGHIHFTYGADIRRIEQCGDTTVINAYERYILEIPDPEPLPPQRKKLFGLLNIGKG